MVVMVMTTVVVHTRGVVYGPSSNLTSIPPEASPGDPILKMRDIPISAIPKDAFISYSNLQRLELINTGVKYIEEGAFSEQNKLTKLSIIGTHGTLSLPSNLGPPTKSLISITLYKTLRRKTEITYPYFVAFKQLKSLNIGGTNIKTLGAHLLPNNMTKFAAAYTNIPTFPSFGMYSPLLEDIVLRNCKMSAVPAQSVVGLEEVKSLVLRSNQLSNLPDISFMKDLIKLQLSDNRLATMPDIYELSLTTLTLADNPLVCDKALCWIRMWPWMKASTVPSDEPTCAGPETMVGMRLMDVDPALMECFRGEFLRNTPLYLSLPDGKMASQSTCQEVCIRFMFCCTS